MLCRSCEWWPFGGSKWRRVVVVRSRHPSRHLHTLATPQTQPSMQSRGTHSSLSTPKNWWYVVVNFSCHTLVLSWRELTKEGCYCFHASFLSLFLFFMECIEERYKLNALVNKIDICLGWMTRETLFIKFLRSTCSTYYASTVLFPVYLNVKCCIIIYKNSDVERRSFANYQLNLLLLTYQLQ